MKQPLELLPEVVIPAEAVSFRAVRSGGPGGQNVNRVATKVELRVEIEAIPGLDAAARERLRGAARLDRRGRIVVTSQRHRDQARNRADAIAKLRVAVVRALEVPRERRPTRVSRVERERRLVEKRRRAEAKRSRRDLDG